jgi:hypothetical protein
MKPNFAVARLGIVLLAVLYATCCRDAHTAARAPLPERFTPGGRGAVVSALERLRLTGSFNHPNYPWVVRARHVDGDKAYFVEFLRRRDGDDGFECVGKAVQVTIRFSEEFQPFAFPGLDDPLPPERREAVRVTACQMEMQMADGSSAYFAERTFDLPLPARLPESRFRPFAEAEAHLSHELAEAFGKRYPLRSEQKKLLAAFGDQCYELLQGDILVSETGRRVFAFLHGRAVGVGQLEFQTLAVAQFDSGGKVLVQFRGNNVAVRGIEPDLLFMGTESKAVTFLGPGGPYFTLPAVKGD